MTLFQMAMVADRTKQIKERTGEYRYYKKKRRRTPRSRRRRFFWAGIILFIALILGALVATSEQYFSKYFLLDEEYSTSARKDIMKKIKDVDINRLLREKGVVGK